MSKQYQLILNEQQAQILVDALELYSRIGMGQLEYIVEHREITKRIFDNSASVDTMPDARDLFEEAKKKIFGYSMGESAGIHSQKIDDASRVAWDVHQVIRNRLAWDRAGNPEKRDWNAMIGVHYDTPMRSSQQPLPIITEYRAE